MKSTIIAVCLVLGLAAGATAQTDTPAAAQTEVRTVTVTGEVIRYEPGKVIEIRGSDDKVVTYVLTPSVTVPAELQVGNRVTLYTAREEDGSTVVRRVTTSVTPEGRTQRTTEETRTSATGGTTTTTTTTVTGEVVNYEPGRTIVIREPNKETVTYTLAPDITVPEDVQVGKSVTVYTKPAPQGGRLVSRVTTTTTTPEGNVKRTTTETRRHPAGVTTKTTRTTIIGKVQVYEPGKTITIVEPSGTEVTYVLNEQSQVPEDLVVGRMVEIRPLTTTETKTRIARTIVYVRRNPQD